MGDSRQTGHSQCSTSVFVETDCVFFAITGVCFDAAWDDVAALHDCESWVDVRGASVTGNLLVIGSDRCLLGGEDACA